MATTEELDAVQRAEDLLTALPEDPEDIAHLLHGKGIKGLCGSPAVCALAEYLKREVPPPGGGRWSVGGDLTLYARQGFATLADRREMPQKAQDFIIAFDDGHFPYLEAEEQ